MVSQQNKVKAHPPTPATALPKFPWAVEVLGHKRRIVDAEGNDLFLMGDLFDATDRETAEFIVAAANERGARDGS